MSVEESWLLLFITSCDPTIHVTHQQALVLQQRH
jgi:hypothetical protein